MQKYLLGLLMVTSFNAHCQTDTVVVATGSMPALKVLKKTTLNNAAEFIIENASSTHNAVSAETRGSGVAVQGVASAAGVAGNFQNNDPTSYKAQLVSYNVGLGHAFLSQAAGAAGSAGKFENSPFNNASLLFGDNLGTGSGLYLRNHLTTGTNPVFVGFQEGLGLGIDISLSNANSDATGIKSTNNSLGKAGEFIINNGLNNTNAIYAESNGSGAVIEARTIFGGSNFKGIKPINASGHIAEFINLHAGNGSSAVSVKSNSNFGSVMEVDASGTATGILANKSGNASGRLIEAINTNNANIADAIYASTTGNGSAIEAVSAGNVSPSIYGLKTGIGGPAGNFMITNVGNPSNALTTSTSGTGSAFFAQNTGTGTSLIANKSGTATGITAIFQNLNSNNSSGVIFASTVGNGSAIEANSTGSSISPVITARHVGAGRAGYFEILNSSNPQSAIEARTNGNGLGYAISAISTGVGTPFIANKASSTVGDIARFSANSLIVARINTAGRGFFNGGTQNSGADLAEAFEVEGDLQTYDVGDVLAISTTSDRKVEKSNEAYSYLIAGVYATKPGILLTEENIEASLDQHIPMGVVGVIPTKVCNEGGAIKRGDLIVSASLAGYAMKGNPEKVKPGQILGKALENFDAKVGKIKVLVNIH